MGRIAYRNNDGNAVAWRVFESRGSLMIVMKTVLASLATVARVCGTLMFAVFLLASMANIIPEQSKKIIRITWVIAGGGTLCMIAASWLTVVGYPVWGGVVGSLPLATFILSLLMVAIISV